MKNKIFVGLAIVIIIGAIMIAVLGFNVDICYKAYNLVDIEIGKDFNMSDIKSITDEVFPGKKVEIQVAGTYSDNIVLKIDEISDEQKSNLATKINEKFGLEKTVDDIEVNYIPNYKLIDIVKPYLIPMCIATAIVLAYIAIRFRKMGIVKVLSQVIVLSVVAELFYIALVAITRYPVNRLFMPVAVMIYLIILTVLTGMFEKQKSMEIQKK